MTSSTDKAVQLAADMQMPLEIHAISALYCKLFSDTITAGICTLRKRELHGHGAFSCNGCSLETSSAILYA